MTLQFQLEQAKADFLKVEDTWHKAKIDCDRAHPDKNKSKKAYAEYRQAFTNCWHKVDADWHRAFAKVERIKALINKE